MRERITLHPCPPLAQWAAALAVVAILAAAPPANAHVPDLEVWMMTFGPGEPVFLKFGHNAILIRGKDHDAEFARVYDYGLFDGTSPTLVADFLQGRMQYWVGVTTLDRTMRRYRATNRDVAAQKLRLSKEQAFDLFRSLERNVQPEYRNYRYDYYYDNCSTRVRDALDEVTEGAVKRAFAEPASMTLREHTLRHTANDWLYYLGLDVGLANVDDAIDQWVESFLPQKLREGLRRVQVEVDGQSVPLVEEEAVWFKSTRAGVPASPPAYLLWMIMVGVFSGGALSIIAWFGRLYWVPRWLFLLLASSVSFVFGFFGLLLLFLWGFTDHAIAYGNENVFHLAPFGLLAPIAVLLSLKPGRYALTALLTAAAVLSVVGLLLKVVPIFSQDTYRLIGLLLPIWGGMALGAWWLARRPGPKTAN